MHIKCSKNDLLIALQTVFSAISTKTSLPILSNILFKISTDNVLELISTDLEITIKTKLEAEILKSGTITIPAKKLLDITRELGEDEIELKVDEDAKVSIKSGKSKFSIMGINSEDFPAIPEFDTKDYSTSFSINKDIFKDMIKKTSYAVSFDETRFVLNGILIKIENNKIIMVATDGRRLCYIDNELENAKVDNFEVIIPTKTINELNKIIGMFNIEKIDIGVKDNQIAFNFGENILISKIIDGIFPNYNQVIPKNLDIEITLSKDVLMASTRRVALLTNDKTNSVKYSFWNNKLIISASTQGVGDAEDEIEIEYDKTMFEIAYNPNYIMDFLKNIDEKEVILQVSTPINPGIIKPKGENSYICVVMPMRI
jgi:DNA polymerase-3 subunit beta